MKKQLLNYQIVFFRAIQYINKITACKVEITYFIHVQNCCTTIVKKSDMYKILATFMVAVIMICHGCCCIPFPSDETLDGRKVDNSDNFIVIGTTTRTEIIQKFKNPDADFKDIRVICYRWEKMNYDIYWGYCFILPPGSALGAGINKYSTLSAFAIAFDENDKVSNYETIEFNCFPSYDSLKEAAVKWAQKHNPKLQERLSKNFQEISVPEGKSLIYIFRPGGFTDKSSLVAPEVYINNVYIAGIRKGMLSYAIISPGTHIIRVDAGPSIADRRSGSYGKNLFVEHSLNDSSDYISVKTDVDSIYYVKVWIGMFSGKPSFEIQSQDEAVSYLKNLEVTGFITE